MAHIVVAAYFLIHLQDGPKSFEFSCRDDQTILEAADEAGIPFERSCGVGMCTSCSTKLAEGGVELGEGHVSGDECLEEGLVLACVAYPRSDLKLIANSDQCQSNLYSQ